jgi:hypothetical protein
MDSTLESDSITLEDLKYISKVILQENQKSMQKMQKEFDKVIVIKTKKFLSLKNHSQNLIALD